MPDAAGVPSLSTSAFSCAGMIFDSSSLKKKISDSSTMLLYELPSGFAMISFDGVDLNIPMEDLWAYPPKNVRLEEFKKFEEKSTAIDLTNGVVGKDLSEMLTKFCGSEQKLLVGRAEYKRIFEEKLGITCQYDNIVDELIWSLENTLHTLLPEETSEPKEYHLPRGKGLILFLGQYGFVVEEDLVTRCIVEKARVLYHLELRERQYLELLCNSIKKFIDVPPLTKNWSLLKFATALKFLCYPKESYEIWGPHKILSAAEYEGVTSMRRKYRNMIKAEIDVFSVYQDAYELYSERTCLIYKLSFLIPVQPNSLKMWNDHFLGIADLTDLPTGSEVGKEAITDVDSMLDSERKNHMEVSGAKGVRAARSLENAEQPHTDGTDGIVSKEDEQTQKTGANGTEGTRSANELDLSKKQQDLASDKQQTEENIETDVPNLLLPDGIVSKEDEQTQKTGANGTEGTRSANELDLSKKQQDLASDKQQTEENIETDVPNLLLPDGIVSKEDEQTQKTGANGTEGTRSANELDLSKKQQDLPSDKQQTEENNETGVPNPLLPDGIVSKEDEQTQKTGANGTEGTTSANELDLSKKQQDLPSDKQPGDTGAKPKRATRSMAKNEEKNQVDVPNLPPADTKGIGSANENGQNDEVFSTSRRYTVRDALAEKEKEIKPSWRKALNRFTCFIPS